MLIDFIFFLTVVLMGFEANSQEICHDIISRNGKCDEPICGNDCSKLHPGSIGLCVQAFFNRFNCQCSWKCD